MAIATKSTSLQVDKCDESALMSGLRSVTVKGYVFHLSNKSGLERLKQVWRT